MFARNDKPLSSDKNKAYDAALSFLDRRDHSREELKNKLSEKFTPDAAGYAVEKCLQMGYVDDGRYARDYARYLSERKRLAPRGIISKLISRGIEPGTAREAVDEIGIDEGAAALEIARELLDPGADDKEKRRVARRLTSKGYSASSVSDAIRIASEEDTWI